MNLVKRVFSLLWILSLSAACSVANPSEFSAPAAATLTPMATLSAAVPTSLPEEDKLARFPRCNEMQVLNSPIQFYWPNLDERMQEFAGSNWSYYSCEQLPAEVAALYREQMPRSPFNSPEINWFEREEGMLGVFFSSKGSWDYVWILPQPNDAQSSYIIIAESFAYVEC